MLKFLLNSLHIHIQNVKTDHFIMNRFMILIFISMFYRRHKKTKIHQYFPNAFTTILSCIKTVILDSFIRELN